MMCGFSVSSYYRLGNPVSLGFEEQQCRYCAPNYILGCSFAATGVQEQVDDQSEAEAEDDPKEQQGSDDGSQAAPGARE